MQTGSLWLEDKKQGANNGPSGVRKKTQNITKKGPLKKTHLVQPLTQSSVNFDQVTNNNLLQV